MVINPNSIRSKVDNIDLENENNFPKFIRNIKFKNFKQIDDLSVNFTHPISVISGINRSGKTTILIAIACSHLKFKKRNIKNGNLERHTWSSFIKMTRRDLQENDWEYSITYKEGRRKVEKSGKRNSRTNKWSGIGKKESQFKDREVRFIDLSRMLPARNFGDGAFKIANKQILPKLENIQNRLKDYVSYIFEEKLIQSDVEYSSYQDKNIFNYVNENTYSSFNAASGEESLMKMLFEILEVPNGSLILIDEVDVGLHPKIQRRMLDVLYHIVLEDKKQFILTTHSQTILSSVPPKSRIFINNNNYKFSCLQEASTNLILSKMDSSLYPLLDIYCEDEIAKKIIEKLLLDIDEKNEYKQSLNIMVCGSAKDTYYSYKLYEKTYKQRKIKTGYVCILDGDMKREFPDCDIHFLFGELTDKAPEHFLLDCYLIKNPHASLSYHLESSNNHIFFDKMVEFVESVVNSDDAFEICWNEFKNSSSYDKYLDEFKNFIQEKISKFKEES